VKHRALFLSVLVVLLLASLAHAKEEERLSMKIGDTHVITVSEHTTVIPGNEKIVKVLSKGNNIVLKAIAAGYSTVTVGDVIYKVTVYTEDSLEELKDLVEDLLIDVEGISVQLAAGRVLIDGEVYTDVDRKRVEDIVEAFEMVASLVRVDPKIVELKPMFRIAFDLVEVDRIKAKEYGMNLSGNMAAMVFDWVDVIRNGPTVNLDNMINFDATEAFTRVWESHEATVVNGEECHYRYGGLLLLPIATANSVGVVEKEYGITLDVTPRVDRRDNVEMQVSYTISDIIETGSNFYDFSEKAQDTTVLLKEGQSLALAGVVRHKTKRELAGLPWLQEIPLLGAFFSTRGLDKGDTDGVIFVTPYLIEPDGQENQDLIDRNIERYREMRLWP
jgi:pilus assembly protein CpaC